VYPAQLGRRPAFALPIALRVVYACRVLQGLECLIVPSRYRGHRAQLLKRFRFSNLILKLLGQRSCRSIVPLSFGMGEDTLCLITGKQGIMQRSLWLSGEGEMAC
jgi:hypothetical protein